MKKYINGKRYDTETAKMLAEYDNSLPRNDFGYYEETLYLKKNGEYFLHGWGGGNSRYGEWHGNTGGPGAKIMPMTLEEATAWAEENLNGDEYEAIFGDPGEDDEAERLNLLVPAATKAKLERMGQQLGKPMSQVVAELIEKAP